jgi:hypothetical protein
MLQLPVGKEKLAEGQAALLPGLHAMRAQQQVEYEWVVKSVDEAVARFFKQETLEIGFDSKKKPHGCVRVCTCSTQRRALPWRRSKHHLTPNPTTIYRYRCTQCDKVVHAVKETRAARMYVPWVSDSIEWMGMKRRWTR